MRLYRRPRMFNLTKQERTVLLFLAGVVLIGSLLQVIVKQSSSARHFFEFTQQDRVTQVDINSADLDSLKKIPYVGEATARAIRDARDKKGGFKSLDELLSVKGIGPRKLQLIKPFLKVGP